MLLDGCIFMTGLTIMDSFLTTVTKNGVRILGVKKILASGI